MSTGSSEGARRPAGPGAGDGEGPVRVIRPPTSWAPLDLAQLWRFRDLVYFVALRDVKLRYRQTLLGVAWAVLQPLLTTLVFAVFFGRLGGMPSEGLPYPVFALAGLLPWQLFAYGLIQGSNSLVESQAIVRKVYFPRIVIPVASLGVGLLDFLVSLGLLGVAMAVYGVGITWRALALVPLAALAAAAALGVALWFSVLNVRYRDVRYTLPFLSQLWLLATPVAYPASLVPERWRWLVGLNPMAGVVEGFRWAVRGQGAGSGQLVLMAAAVAAALLLSGLLYFRRAERGFADVI